MKQAKKIDFKRKEYLTLMLGTCSSEMHKY